MPPVARLRNPHSPEAPAAGNVRPRCMIRLARRSPFLCLAGLVLLCAGCGTARTGREAVLHPTLERTVMVGYQGWYRTPEDGSGLGWSHYQAPREKAPAPGRIASSRAASWAGRAIVVISVFPFACCFFTI